MIYTTFKGDVAADESLWIIAVAAWADEGETRLPAMMTSCWPVRSGSA